MIKIGKDNFMLEVKEEVARASNCHKNNLCFVTFKPIEDDGIAIHHSEKVGYVIVKKDSCVMS